MGTLTNRKVVKLYTNIKNLIKKWTKKKMKVARRDFEVLIMRKKL